MLFEGSVSTSGSGGLVKRVQRKKKEKKKKELVVKGLFCQREYEKEEKLL